MVTQTTEHTAAQSMVETANEQITDLEGTLANLAHRITEAEAELITITDARDARAQALQEARAQVKRLEEDYSQKEAYAKLALGTVNEQPAIQAAATVKKSWQAAKKPLEGLERETAEADRADQAREQELGRQVQLLKGEQEARQDELRRVQSGRRQAHAELGAAHHATIRAMYQEKQAHIESLRQQLVEAESNLELFHESALHVLADWPQLQKDIACMQQADDATSRILAATLHYVETLRKDVPEVDGVLPQAFGNRGISFWDLVIVPNAEIFSARRHPQQFLPRLTGLKSLLDEYRAYLAR